jgi:hypothetical protein
MAFNYYSGSHLPRSQLLAYQHTKRGRSFLYSFRLLLKYSLGMPLILLSQRCLDCNTIIDIYGDHPVTCKTASGVIDKHISIVKSLVLKMKNAGMSCSYEAKNLTNPTLNVRAIFWFLNSTIMVMLI